MALTGDLAIFEKSLDNAINDTLTHEVTDKAKEYLADAIQSEVYDKWDPKMYIRQKTNGGLQDPSLMEATLEDPINHILTVQDVRRDDHTGRLVAPVVESGEGYNYVDIPARPFHIIAEKNLETTGAFQNSVTSGLRSRGFVIN